MDELSRAESEELGGAVYILCLRRCRFSLDTRTRENLGKPPFHGQEKVTT